MKGKKSNTISTYNEKLSGRDFYSQLYSDSIEKEAEWLKRRSYQTADSICALLERNDLTPSKILEIGCGTGAVIAELQRRGIADSYYAIDYSSEAIEYVHSTLPDVHAVTGDVVESAELFEGQNFDLVICAHVLEHLEEPKQFLKSLRGLTYLNFLAEVPLENLFFGKIKSLFQDRGNHPAGHVQFFDQNSFRNILIDAGLNIMDQNLYAPVLDKDTLKFRYGNESRLYYLFKMSSEHYGPRYLGAPWIEYYHAHMSVLCGGT